MEHAAPLAQLLTILRRRIRLIVTVGSLGTMVAALAASLVPQLYTAKSQIVIDGDRPVPIAGQVITRDNGADEATILTEVTALTSHDLLNRVRHNLHDGPSFAAIRAARASSRAEGAASATPPNGFLGAWRSVGGFIGRTINSSVEYLSRARNPGENSAADFSSGLDDGTIPTQDEMRRHLKVFQEQGSHVIAISYSSTNPEEAAAVSNEIAKLYIDSHDEQRRASSDRALAGLEHEIPKLKAEVERLESAAIEYQNANGLNDATRIDVMDRKLEDLSKQLSEAQSELAVRNARRGRLKELRGNTPDWSGLLSRLNAQGMVELHAQLLAVLQSRADTITPSPQIAAGRQDDRTASVELRKKLQNDLDQTLAKLDDDAAAAAAKVGAIQERITSVRAASDDVHLRDLVATAASSRHRFERLLQRREELLEQRDGISAMARLLSFAPAPDRPSTPNPMFFIPPAIVAFFLSGCFLAVLRDRLDQTILSESDLTDALGIGCIGFVPRLRALGRRRPHEYLLAKLYSPYAESVRAIMASLQVSESARRAPKVILVTSSVPGEGKTTIAVSLGAYAAASGKRVLLLDLDFRRSAMARELGNFAGRGALDILTEERADDVSAIHSIAGLRLDYLPARSDLIADGLPLLAGDKLARLLQCLRCCYDYIVIDSAPLLAVAETRLLAVHADKILFVARWGKTRRNEAENAFSLLRLALPSLLVSSKVAAVVTQVDLKRHARARFGDSGEVLSRYSKYYLAR